ncbi:hypothetical protein [Pectobacterium sp. CHL-2024]|uniref:hypothetical protein n=1 Tax=Pectobacterium sp. CHL-2024 TaxID=3377079 RepID=UPI0038018231
MNVPRKLKERFEKISPELFSDFLGLHGVLVLACPICHKIGMSIPQVQVHQSVISVGGSEQDNEFNSSHVFSYVDFICVDANAPDQILSYEYRVICKNCGFSNHFAVHPVVQWVEQRTVQKDNNGEKNAE